ncbi:MAG TPA: hypothetical protein VF134_06950 [Candidatus Dormibacteraeota bacterium]
MIDQTNVNIEHLEEEIRRENRRRYAFQRMLRSTDSILWRLEELNRDGVKTLNKEQRSDIRTAIAELPGPCMDVFRDSERVQEVLDSIFDVQECLFRGRFPEFGFDEEDETLAS